MDNASLHKRVLLYVFLPLLAFYLGFGLFAQYRHVDLYSGQIVAMPSELAESLKELKPDRTMLVERPYENADQKPVTPDEIRELRTALAWSRIVPPLFDSITFHSPTSALGRRTTSRVMLEYHIVRRGDRWIIQSTTRSKVRR